MTSLSPRQFKCESDATLLRCKIAVRKSKLSTFRWLSRLSANDDQPEMAGHWRKP